MKIFKEADLSQAAHKIIDNMSFVVFITIIAGSLIGCLFALVDIVYMSYDITNSSSNMSDQTTINKLNVYETSLRNSTYKVTPDNEINPFTE